MNDENRTDEEFMKLAINEAKKSPFPFGCVLVKNNKVMASGRSGETKTFDPTAHAEINAIRFACNKLKSMDLTGVTLYSTCEPCPMCFTAEWYANIDRIVFGVSLKESAKLFEDEILINSKYLNMRGNNKIIIKGGVLKEEIFKMYKKHKK